MQPGLFLLVKVLFYTRSAFAAAFPKEYVCSYFHSIFITSTPAIGKSRSALQNALWGSIPDKGKDGPKNAVYAFRQKRRKNDLMKEVVFFWALCYYIESDGFAEMFTASTLL